MSTRAYDLIGNVCRVNTPGDSGTPDPRRLTAVSHRGSQKIAKIAKNRSTESDGTPS